MRITESQLRKIVRQEILRESEVLGPEETQIVQTLLDYLQTPEGRRAGAAASQAVRTLQQAGLSESFSRDEIINTAGPVVAGSILYALAMKAGVQAGGEQGVVAALVGIPIGLGVAAMVEFLSSKLK